MLLPLVMSAALLQEMGPQRLAEELRIGEVDGPGSLTAVTSVAIAPRGNLLFVAQHTEGVIRVFDVTSKRFVKEIGRRGRGPGEFQMITRLGWRGDTLVVTDMVQQRIVLMSTDGKVLRTLTAVSKKHPEIDALVVPAALTPDELIWAEPRGNPRRTQGRNIVPTVTMTTTGEIVKIVAKRDNTEYGKVIDLKKGVFVFTQPFAYRPHREFAPDGSSVVTVEAKR